MKPKEQILLETNTELEHYLVVDRVYEGRPARVLFSGPQRAAQSGIGLDDDPDLLFDYNQRLLEVANALYPSRILVIGGGAFTLPQALVVALPEATVDVVELDPGLETIAAKYFGLQENDRLHITYTDGRAFVEQSREQYDLVILDVFSELAIPRQFLTVEFIAMLHEHLTSTGCVALNIIASYQGRN
ncbi:MAG TPA: fused MFS/spermidine synthase, partial [Candidatus Saccharimonadales bacterium]